jgi:hypothetical protein
MKRNAIKIHRRRDEHHTVRRVGNAKLPPTDKTEGTMATAFADTTSNPRSDTHHYFGAVPIAFCARFVEATRQRQEQRRMLRAVQELDHPGVLADVQAACAAERELVTGLMASRGQDSLWMR